MKRHPMVNLEFFCSKAPLTFGFLCQMLFLHFRPLRGAQMKAATPHQITNHLDMSLHINLLPNIQNDRATAPDGRYGRCRTLGTASNSNRTAWGAPETGPGRESTSPQHPCCSTCRRSAKGTGGSGA